MANFTTTEFLASVARKTFSPTGQTTFSSADILAIADEESISIIIPEILSEREEYFLTHSDQILVASQQAYLIPTRAVGLVVREVSLVDSSNNVIDLAKIEIEDIQSTNLTGTPSCFFLKGNSICLYPTPDSTSSSLRLYYFINPGELVEVSESGVISAINTTTRVVTVSTIPSTWVTGNIFDFISSSGGSEYRDTDYTSTLISGADITFTTLPSNLSVGDYISIQGTSPLIQLPKEFGMCLVQATVTVLLESQNLPGADKAANKLMKMLDSAKKLISPRVIGEPKRILPPSWLR
jgi:hypothetical protein